MKRGLPAALVPALAAAAGAVLSLSGSVRTPWAPAALPSVVLSVAFVFLWRFAVVPAALLAGGVALGWCWPLAQGNPAIPTRSRVLFWILAALTAAFFGVHLLRDDVVGGNALACALFLDGAWLGVTFLLGRLGARAPSLAASSAYHAALFGGLFWCGFPLVIAKSFVD